MNEITIAEIELQEQRFLSEPHKTKSLRNAARLYWLDEAKAAVDHISDRWHTVLNYQIKNPKGKLRPLGREIVSTLRSHLAKLQGHRCCYCRRWLQNVAYARPIEHIFSRKDYPQFSVTYRNLAVSCRDCNQLKGAQKWTILPAGTLVYPSAAPNHYHPRLHRYDLHVRYVRVETNDSSIAIYHGLTEQGRQLCKDLLKTISQVDGLMYNNRQFAKSIAILQDAGDKNVPEKTEKLDEFIESLHEAIRRIATRP